MTKYPIWKYCLLVVVTLISLLYTLPNFYGTLPALQIGSREKQPVAEVQKQITAALKADNIAHKPIQSDPQNNTLLIKFADTDVQFKAQQVLKQALGEAYTVALNLAPAAPAWLGNLGAIPMKLGLDLQGGMHFLLEVDINSVVAKRLDDNLRTVGKALRDARIRYSAIGQGQRNTLDINLRSQQALDQAYDLLRRDLPEYQLKKSVEDKSFHLFAQLTPQALQDVRQQTIEQTMTILRNRVNELGVSEAVVQQQGVDRIAVDLPGVQDSARAQHILGETSTLEFHLVDETHDANSVIGGVTPVGTRLYHTKQGRPLLLKNQVLLYGKSITSASATIGENGQPAVNISTSGSDVRLFSHMTARNIGRLMAIVYVQTKLKHEKIDGKLVPVTHKSERVISVATINQALSYNFVINGIDDMQEANNLALLLRSGALIAPVNILESRLVGPSLGAENIHKGFLSLKMGMILVMLFMLLYYRVFGLVANIALLLNLIILTAILSVVGAVLTLPGIAGIVLTLGMAIDANVLIYERIREELRNGMPPQAAISAGYERALTTIVDANLTTLIVGMILFSIGVGAVKGFAVTLTLGILTSMLTGLTFTRAIIYLIYGRGPRKRIAIGI